MLHNVRRLDRPAISIRQFLLEPVGRVRIRVVRFSFNEAEGRVETACLNEVTDKLDSKNIS